MNPPNPIESMNFVELKGFVTNIVSLVAHFTCDFLLSSTESLLSFDARSVDRQHTNILATKLLTLYDSFRFISKLTIRVSYVSLNEIGNLN